MSDWPISRAPVLSSLTPWHPDCPVAPLLSAVGGGMNQFANTAWTSQRIIYVPFWLHERVTVAQLYVEVGTTSNGNVDMGLYNVDGVYLASKGSTATGTVSTLQVLDITDTVLGPGQFYLAFWCDSGTATFKTISIGSAVRAAACGVMEQLSQSALPTTTATFANASVVGMPHIGLTLSATI